MPVSLFTSDRTRGRRCDELKTEPFGVARRMRSVKVMDAFTISWELGPTSAKRMMSSLVDHERHGERTMLNYPTQWKQPLYGPWKEQGRIGSSSGGGDLAICAIPSARVRTGEQYHAPHAGNCLPQKLELQNSPSLNPFASTPPSHHLPHLRNQREAGARSGRSKGQ